jgi:hypothetical protein
MVFEPPLSTLCKNGFVAGIDVSSDGGAFESEDFFSDFDGANFPKPFPSDWLLLFWAKSENCRALGCCVINGVAGHVKDETDPAKKRTVINIDVFIVISNSFCGFYTVGKAFYGV